MESPRGGLEVALSHDWLVGMRGGERVLELLCSVFPGADVYTLIYDPDAVSEAIRSHKVNTSALQRLPGIRARYRMFLPLMPAIVESFRVPEVDLLISTSHCVAKGIRTKPGTKHLCYCFTPMRYAWLFYEEYFGTNPLKKAVLKPTLAALRGWDRRTANRVDLFVAISRHVRDRIERFYGREAEVVYPPVDTDYWTPGPAGDGGYDLVVSAMVPYKRVDLVVDAYDRSGRKLKVVGSGPLADRLAATAGTNVEFLGWVDNERLRDIYRGCNCLVFPGEEDFGIIPVEVQACGRPVVAYACGGATETVVDGVSGVFFAQQDVESLNEAVEKCAATKWDREAIRANAERFRASRFIAELQACIADLLGTSGAG